MWGAMLVAESEYTTQLLTRSGGIHVQLGIATLAVSVEADDGDMLGIVRGSRRERYEGRKQASEQRRQRHTSLRIKEAARSLTAEVDNFFVLFNSQHVDKHLAHPPIIFID
jgi:hypothetical protein